MWQFEHHTIEKGYQFIAGIDEAGRGPLAGPVVSAAVILPVDFSCPGVQDSKQLSEKKREMLFPEIRDQALAVGIGMADAWEIDEINILQASLLSMKRAVENLGLAPDFLLIDGKFTIDSHLPQQAIVKGDSKSISIAAASILAKVVRDRIMAQLHLSYPLYNFIQHKGYPTQAHRQALKTYGPSPVHRKTFKGVLLP